MNRPVTTIAIGDRVPSIILPSTRGKTVALLPNPGARHAVLYFMRDFY